MVRERTIETDVETGRHRGLAYALWMPAETPPGAIVILHGAGSCKESHFDFGRAARDMGLAALECPLLLLHAEGDEQVPVDHSRALHEAAPPDRSRLLVMPGGHHRSIQHDGELQGESLRFVLRAFAA